MAAYERVAQMVGASELWVRRFVCGYSEAKPSLVVGFNILESYRRIATRVAATDTLSDFQRAWLKQVRWDRGGDPR
jgi:hypothetical protein